MFEIAAYTPFVIGGWFILGILAIEALFLLAGGLTTGELISSLVDTDTFPETAVTNWLFIKGLPLSIFLVVFLCGFSVSGALIQRAAKGYLDIFLSNWLAMPLAIACGYWLVKRIGPAIARLLVEESQSVSQDELLGLEAVLHSPVARFNFAGEAKVTDQYGYRHTVWVTPHEDADVDHFVEGDFLRLESLDGNTFRASKISVNLS